MTSRDNEDFFDGDVEKRTNPTLSHLAQQNDAFRSGSDFHSPLMGSRLHTQGIDALGLETVLDIWARVRAFSEFSVDNDPYGEHDFGSFDHPVAGKIFWKIDYYALDLKYGAEDPSDPLKTHRVLTVMLAIEY